MSDVNIAMVRAFFSGTAKESELDSLAVDAGVSQGVVWSDAVGGPQNVPVEEGKLPVSIQFEESHKYMTWNMSWAEIAEMGKLVDQGLNANGLGSKSAESKREMMRLTIMGIFGGDDYLRGDSSKAVVPCLCYLLTHGEQGRQLREVRDKLLSVGYSVSKASPLDVRFRLAATFKQH